ncbi:hypothetical protein CTI12_AA412340 [Artemisia annua]|uniref:Replication factor A C-terminal domain-containing protein n=1 Tax=Artemisia annua TaxID=35608 RepID=A0A2U1M6G4_ARTAN|nr:hypothetical protein CTI12_AA412340 [Artemisia annua]
MASHPNREPRNDERYHIGTYTYSWVLSNKTLVEELVENTLAPISCHFEFTNFSDLHKYADSDSLQNVRAIVLQCFPSQEQDSEITSRRDVVIVNEELLLLTLWNQYDEKEGRTLADIGPGVMIFGMRLKVTTFNSLSLTTRGGNSGFMINPPVSQELQMQEWYNGNREGLQQLLEQRTYRNSDILLPYPQDDDVISIASFVASWRTLKSSWIKGRTTFPRQDRSLWYTACANCQKSLEADLSWIVTCPSCHQESELEAISRLAIRIDDGTANLSATICSADAEKLIPFNATQLRDADEHGINLHDDIVTSVQRHMIVAFVRTYETTFHGQTELKVNVVKAYIVEEVLPAPKLIGHESEKETCESTLDVDNPCTISVKNVAGSFGKEKLGTSSEGINVPNAFKAVKRSSPLSDTDFNGATAATISEPRGTLSKKEDIGEIVDTAATISKSQGTLSKNAEAGSHAVKGRATKKNKGS